MSSIEERALTFIRKGIGSGALVLGRRAVAELAAEFARAELSRAGVAEMREALRPQLNAKARREVEEMAEACEAMSDTGTLATSLRFLLERQDAAKAALSKADGGAHETE